MIANPEKQAVIEQGLEHAAETLGDIVPLVMARVYARTPAARDMFDHYGLGARARLEAEMVDNSLYCVMTWFVRPEEIKGLLYTSVPHHNDALEVPADWYSDMLRDVINIVVETLPSEAANEQAIWREVESGLIAAIEATRPYFHRG